MDVAGPSQSTPLTSTLNPDVTYEKAVEIREPRCAL